MKNIAFGAEYFTMRAKLLCLAAIVVALSSCSSPPSPKTNSDIHYPLASPPVESLQESIEYMVPDGTKRKARLDKNVDVINTHLPWEDAKEPIWIVTQPDGTEVKVEEILFLATDKSHRRLRFDSYYINDSIFPPGGPRIITFFEHAKIATEDWTKKEPGIWFTHPDGYYYRAQVESVAPPYPAQPHFVITK